MAKKKAGGKKATAKPAINKLKKDANLFKVSDAKKKAKKPKEVQGKLKKVKEVIQKKQEKVDANLKTLHKDLVVKPKAAKKPAAAVKKPKKGAGSSKKVSQKLSNLKV